MPANLGAGVSQEVGEAITPGRWSIFMKNDFYSPTTRSSGAISGAIHAHAHGDVKRSEAHTLALLPAPEGKLHEPEAVAATGMSNVSFARELETIPTP